MTNPNNNLGLTNTRTRTQHGIADIRIYLRIVSLHHVTQIFDAVNSRGKFTANLIKGTILNGAMLNGNTRLNG